MITDARHNPGMTAEAIYHPAVHPVMREKSAAFFHWAQTLTRYDTVYVIANSDSDQTAFINIQENDLVILFNHYPEIFIIYDECDAVIIHRQAADTDTYYGHYEAYPGRQHPLLHCIMINQQRVLHSGRAIFPDHQLVFPCDIVPYSADENKIPSSGYALLSLLYDYYGGSDFLKHIIPVGFQFTDTGWYGHDWEYERAQAVSMPFDWRV